MSVTLVCGACGSVLPPLSRRSTCACGGLLDVVQRPAETGRTLRRRFYRRQGSGDPSVAGSGVWRFRELLLPGRGPIVTHPEGNTPLFRRDAISRFAGHADLALKHEGHNPTGSFKDRGMTVAVTHALRSSAPAVACASTGNTSASMAAYAAQAGLKALVFVPAGRIAFGKLAQALAYGARTLLVKADFDACLRLVREAHERLGIALLNSINPWRIEGQKTLVFELLQQRGWEAPDWIVVPAGNLGNTAAFGKALAELRALGLLKRVPRIAAVQARGASPFFRSYRGGFARRYRVRAETAATAIRIGDPASHDRAVRAIRETRGLVTAVSDREILEAKAVVDAAGIGCEPASAASVAGVRRLVAEGVIRKGDAVVAVLTGHLLKDPGAVIDFHSRTGARRNPPVTIAPRLAEVERQLRRL
ncbi:MAG TPA: threonine synthase [Vicinamibacteria bacterium]